MGCACSTHKRYGKDTVLVGKPDGKRPFRRPRRRWEDNIRSDLIEIEREYVDWLDLTQDRDQ